MVDEKDYILMDDLGVPPMTQQTSISWFMVYHNLLNYDISICFFTNGNHMDYIIIFPCKQQNVAPPRFRQKFTTQTEHEGEHVRVSRAFQLIQNAINIYPPLFLPSDLKKKYVGSML